MDVGVHIRQGMMESKSVVIMWMSICGSREKTLKTELKLTRTLIVQQDKMNRKGLNQEKQHPHKNAENVT